MLEEGVDVCGVCAAEAGRVVSSSPRLHPTAEAIYKFIATNLDENRVGPKVREIVAGLELGSTSVVAHHLKQLEKAGRIERPVLYGHRRIVLVEERKSEVEVG